VAVAEMENVSRAATEKLHVAQPSLSRQIRDLEDEIGVELLERTANSVRLTDAGRAFLDEARAVLKHADEAIVKARGIAGKQELRVGDWSIATGGIMPELLRACQHAIPNVKIKLHDWTIDQNITGVRDGRLELAITLAPVKRNALADLTFQEVATARVNLAVSSVHPFGRRKSVPLAKAAREPFIGLTPEKYPRYQEYIDSIFGSVNNKPRIVEEHDGWAGVFSAVAAGTGVAILADTLSHVVGNRVKLLHLTPEPKLVSIGIVMRKGKLSPAAEKFRQRVKDAFAAVR
jgi:LysR family transcriptional regulator, benzoate and cis,cis-muconate-responsive activator of ben and cat genes